MSLLQAIENKKPVRELRAIIEKEKINVKDTKVMQGMAEASKFYASGSARYGTPLHLAASIGHAQAVQLLLDLGAKVNIRDNYKSTPLHEGVLHEDVVKILLERGANVNARDKDGNSPLLLAVMSCDRSVLNVTDRLLSYEANVKQSNNDGYTALHIAMWCTSPALVQRLIQAGVPVNQKTKKGQTPLSIVLDKVSGTWSRNPVAPDIINVLLKHRDTIIYADDYLGIMKTPRLDLSHTLVRQRFDNVVRSYIHARVQTKQVSEIASAFASVMDHQDSTYIKSLVKLFRDAGALSMQREDGYRVLDIVFLEQYDHIRGQSAMEHVCHIFKTSGVRLVDARYPFHVLVNLVKWCSNPFSNKKLVTVVDHLIRQGFNINEPITFSTVARRKVTAISMLENSINAHSFYNKTGHVLQDLHTIMVSRGATTTTGRRSQRFKLRNRLRWFSKTMRDHVSQWTTHTYRSVQDARRRGDDPKNIATRVNRYLSQMFRDGPSRVPSIPREFTVQYNKNAITKSSRPVYLYRGVHGNQANELLKTTRTVIDNGFIAFSRNKDIAYRFANKNNNTPGLVMRLRVDSIPKGTPWIWFQPKWKRLKGERNAHDSEIDEAEVLLPPGMLVVTSLPYRVSPASKYTSPMVDVKYTPDKTATNLTGKKKLIRTRSVRSNNAHDNAATMWFSTLFNAANTTKRSSPKTATASATGKRTKR